MKGPVVTRHRLDAETYALKSRRTGLVVATVLGDRQTDKWQWELTPQAKPPRGAAVKPPRRGTEDSLTEAQAVVEYLVRRHNLDGNGG